MIPAMALAADADMAVQEIKDLLEAKKIDRTMFPEGVFDPVNFSPEEFDPLMLEATWEEVRGSVRAILERRLGLTLQERSLKLYVGKVSEASSIGPDGRTSTSRRYQVMFVERNAGIRDVLMRALSLPIRCFPDCRPVWETYALSDARVTVPWNQIGIVTSDFVSSSARVRQLGFGVQAPVYLSDKVQVVTSWLRYGRRGGYDMYWRLFFQVKKAEQPGVTLVTVRGQVGRNLPGAPTSQIRYLGTEEQDSRFEVPLGRRGVAAAPPTFVPVNPGPQPEDPMAASTSGQLAKDLLEAYVQRLTSG
jgi:hypothetical protein